MTIAEAITTTTDETPHEPRSLADLIEQEKREAFQREIQELGERSRRESAAARDKAAAAARVAALALPLSSARAELEPEVAKDREFALMLARVVCPIPSPTDPHDQERRSHGDLKNLDRDSLKRERNSLELRFHLERLMGDKPDPWQFERLNFFREHFGQWGL